MGRLENKVAIVTGASRGIGRAIAKRFGAEGAKVAVLARNEENVQRTVREITDAGGTAIGIVCDVTDLDRIPAVVQQTVDAFGTVDILVNNAMDVSTTQGTALDTPVERIDAQMRGGPYSHMTFMQCCYPYMKGRGGRVINLASSVGFIGQAGYVPYAVAKEGIRALSRVAAREWAADEITVNIICPVAVTDSFDTAVEANDWDPSGLFPIPRLGSPDKDIAPVAVFLASEEASYMTGYSFMPDGGFMIDAAR
ncbi:MAG: 3-oxoacyl-ACP reductase [Porticoccaceae bacterium]|nr:3-oxoacyl-ACP reductase [Porticoccaceae bacterium]